MLSSTCATLPEPPNQYAIPWSLIPNDMLPTKIGFYKWSTLGQAPIPQFNQLENLDKPMVAKEDLSNLQDYWQERTKEVGSWKDNLWSMFKP